MTVVFILLYGTAHAMPSAASGGSTAPATGSSKPSADSSSDASLETIEASDEEIGFTGNWIKKKDLLLKAYELGDQIRTLTAKIQATRKSFHDKYSAIDDELDNFYKELGLEQGKLQELFNGVLNYLNSKKQKKEDELAKKKKSHTLKDRDFIINIEMVEEEIKKHQRSLDQLKLDMKSVEDLDKSLTDRLKKLDEQIALAIGIAKETKEKTTKLWNILDHSKARAIYFELKGKDMQRLNAILGYLDGDLSQDFDKVSGNIKTQMGQVKERVAALEKEGLIIKNRATRVDELRSKKAAAAAQQKPADTQKPVKKRKVRRKKPATWYGNIYETVIGNTVRSYKYFRDLVLPKAAAKKKKTKKKSSVAAPPVAKNTKPAVPAS